MIKLKLHNGQKRVIYDLFSDVNLYQLKKAYSYLSNNTHVDILKFLKGENNNIDESKLLDFKIDWICLFSDIKKEELTKLAVSSDQDLSIDWLFEKVLKFCYFPEEVVDLKSFKFQGVEYKLIEEIKTISGAKMLFGNGTYNQFKLAQMLARQVKDTLTPNVADSLIQLVAVLYSVDGDNSDEAINSRIEKFDQLSALIGFSALFFFILLTKRYSAFFHLYSSEMNQEVQRALRGVLKLEAKRISFEKGSFGRLLKLKSPKSEFLILERNLDWLQ